MLNFLRLNFNSYGKTLSALGASGWWRLKLSVWSGEAESASGCSASEEVDKRK